MLQVVEHCKCVKYWCKICYMNLYWKLWCLILCLYQVCIYNDLILLINFCRVNYVVVSILLIFLYYDCKRTKHSKESIEMLVGINAQIMFRNWVTVLYRINYTVCREKLDINTCKKIKNWNSSKFMIEELCKIFLNNKPSKQNRYTQTHIHWNVDNKSKFLRHWIISKSFKTEYLGITSPNKFCDIIT